MDVNIWLDDARPAPDGFLWVKSVRELIDTCWEIWGDYDTIGTISLDNDLGDNEEEGIVFLNYLEFCLYRCRMPLPNKIIIHSQNPVAREKMEKIVNRIYANQINRL